MTQKQDAAEATIAPKVARRSQHQRILDHIAQYGSITPWAAIHAVSVHCTKLATRIGEIERKCGHEFQHSMQWTTDADGRRRPLGMKYTIHEGLTLDDFRKRV